MGRPCIYVYLTGKGGVAGVSWTPWAQATDLDASLRQPGWGCDTPYTHTPLSVRYAVYTPRASDREVYAQTGWSSTACPGVCRCGDLNTSAAITVCDNSSYAMLS